MEFKGGEFKVFLFLKILMTRTGLRKNTPE